MMGLILMKNYNKMPREKGMDHSLTLFREGYMYILNRRQTIQSNLFETRLLGEKVICMGGIEAAQLFYDAEKFKRKGAAPNRVIQTLFGKGGVQGLDGKSHKERKEMFMSIMSRSELNRLTIIAEREWERAIERWRRMKKVILYEEVKEILCRTACEWAGVTVQEDEIKNLTKNLGAMFESAGSVGPNHWRGRRARNVVEAWMAKHIENVRQGMMTPPEHTAFHKFAMHSDHGDNLLDIKTAAVEIINILRPIVAIAIYINFIAIALYHYPDETKKIQTGNEKYVEMFIHEVRRFYPFFPYAVARVKRDFIWEGFRFQKGTLTLLDLYGTNHDPKIWDNPEVFHPERFHDWEGGPFGFIPQGGGDYFLGHRCAGEWVTIELMKVGLDFLVNRFDYNIPAQDLSYSMVNIPSIPRSQVVIRNVKRRD